MTTTIYGVCPNCGKIHYKKETTATSGTVESVGYRKGEKCSGGCYGRRANQMPEKRKETK